MHCLYDPRTNILSETSIPYLMELTGRSKSNLYAHKKQKRKIKDINCYLTDENVSLEQRRIWYESETYEDEAWKVVHGSDGKFLISNYGRFKRVRKEKTYFLMPFFHKRTGKLMIKVQFNGRYGQYPIANLVAYHYIGLPKPGEVLHHKNLIKTDNFAGNLEYISRQKLGKKTGGMAKSKPVVQLNKDTMEVINEYRSAREAGRQCYLSYQAVLDNCNHKSRTSGGYIFMFAEEYEKLYLKERDLVG
ncbi:MAG: hypothetical protein IMW92_13805 [Bacillales bacterium]|nr:hypothetical protein [Bacillales bacterium]